MKGKILRLQLGYNPNSSSLGVDVTFLLFGSAAVVALTAIASALLAGRRAKTKAEAGAGRA